MTTLSADPRDDDEAGVFAIEAVPAFIGIFLFALMVFVAVRVSAANTSISSAAQDAARAASHQRDAGSAQAAAQAAAANVLSSDGIKCAPNVTIDTAGFGREAGTAATVAATITCTVPLSDVGPPGTPGSKTFTAHAMSAIDTYRER